MTNKVIKCVLISSEMEDKLKSDGLGIGNWVCVRIYTEKKEN